MLYGVPEDWEIDAEIKRIRDLKGLFESAEDFDPSFLRDFFVANPEAHIAIKNASLVQTYERAISFLEDQKKLIARQRVHFDEGMIVKRKTPGSPTQIIDYQTARTSAFIISSKDGTEDSQFRLRIIFDPHSKLFDEAHDEPKWESGGFSVCKWCYEVSDTNFSSSVVLTPKKKKDANTANELRQSESGVANSQNDVSVKDNDVAKSGSIIAVEGDIESDFSDDKTSDDFKEAQDKPRLSNQVLEVLDRHRGIFSKSHTIQDDTGKPHIYLKRAHGTLFDLIRATVWNDKKECQKKDLNLDWTMVTVDGMKIPRFKLDIICQLINAVTTLHKEGIAHNDLKPDNVIYYYDAKQKRILLQLIDFDPSKTVEFSRDQVGIKGTFPYDPPENLFSDYVMATANGYDHDDISRILGQEYSKWYNDGDRVLGLEKAFAEKGSLWLDQNDSNFSVMLSKWRQEIPSRMQENNYNGNHDIWSLGVTVYELIFGTLPSNDFDNDLKLFESSSLFKGMFETDPANRASAAELMHRIKTISSLTFWNRYPPTDISDMQYFFPNITSNNWGLDSVVNSLLGPDISVQSTLEKFHKYLRTKYDITNPEVLAQTEAFGISTDEFKKVVKGEYTESLLEDLRSRLESPKNESTNDAINLHAWTFKLELRLLLSLNKVNVPDNTRQPKKWSPMESYRRFFAIKKQTIDASKKHIIGLVNLAERIVSANKLISQDARSWTPPSPRQKANRKKPS